MAELVELLGAVIRDDKKEEIQFRMSILPSRSAKPIPACLAADYSPLNIPTAQRD